MLALFLVEVVVLVLVLVRVLLVKPTVSASILA
jgi:hypothetical protein